MAAATFDFHRLRLQFTALDRVVFPPGLPGNILRGAFGTALRRIGGAAYDRIFAPVSGGRLPAGYADAPRPFVLRARELDGRRIEPGGAFAFDVHLFETRQPPLAEFVLAFAQIGDDGIGPGRGRAALHAAWLVDGCGAPLARLYDASGFVARELPEPVRHPLAPARPAARLRVEFLTPTELRFGQELVETPGFGALFARARDRVSVLREFWGGGPLKIEFRAAGERARAVSMGRCSVRHVQARRRSSRTLQVHGIGGFVGAAEYEGELGEFVPVLEAAQWTGIGRHTVWGNGEIAVTVLA